MKINYNQIHGAPANVLDFGADPTGVADSTGAIQAAINAISNDGTVLVPPGTYKLTSGLTISNGYGNRLVGIGKPTLNFTGLGATVDGITVVGANYAQSELRNLTINMNSSGRDGVVIQAGDAPVWENIMAKNTVRDAYSFQPSGYQWISSGSFKQLRGQTVGRHGFRFYLSGSNGAFINECEFQRCELRGISQVTAGANAIYASSDANNAGSSVSALSWINCNFDAQSLAGAAKCGDNAVYIAYSTQPVRATMWKILGGGWEDTSAHATTAQPYIYVQANAQASGWFVTGIIPSAWCQFFSSTNSPTQSLLHDGNQGSLRMGGAILSPGNCRFYTYQTVGVSNVTGDSTQYALGSAGVTAVYDELSSVNTANNIFTAPYTGKYRFMASVTITGLGAGHTYGGLGFNVPSGSYAGTYWLTNFNPYVNSSSGNTIWQATMDLALNAGDTVKPMVYVSNSTKTVGVLGGYTSTSIFQGSLLG